MKQYSDTVIDFVWFCIHELGDDAAAVKNTLGCSIAQVLQVFKQAHEYHNPFYNPHTQRVHVAKYKPPVTYKRPHPTFKNFPQQPVQTYQRPKGQYSNPHWNQIIDNA